MIYTYPSTTTLMLWISWAQRATWKMLWYVELKRRFTSFYRGFIGGLPRWCSRPTVHQTALSLRPRTYRCTRGRFHRIAVSIQTVNCWAEHRCRVEIECRSGASRRYAFSDWWSVDSFCLLSRDICQYKMQHHLAHGFGVPYSWQKGISVRRCRIN